MDYEIIPAILVESLEEFQDQIELAESFAQTVQWDVMDGHFVEQITFNDPDELEHVDTTLTLEAHLMVEDPESLLEGLASAGVDRVIAHAESTDDLEGLVEKMRSFEFEVGIAINPETEVEEIESILDKVDVILVMTVIPGASGQSFMDEQLDKISELREINKDIAIAVDGGINPDTIKLAKEAGANRFGVNSAIFENPDPANAYEVLSNLIA